MNAHHDTNGAEHQPVDPVSAGKALRVILCASLAGWAVILGVIGWAAGWWE